MVKKNVIVLFSVITLLVVILDQISKYLITKFNPNYSLGFLTVHLTKNTGAGFGILQGYTLWLALISLIVTVVIIFSYQKIPQEKIDQVLFALFLGGVIGNLIDRFFLGYVIDFIELSFWPAFNLADSAITVAVGGLIWVYWKKS